MSDLYTMNNFSWNYNVSMMSYPYPENYSFLRQDSVIGRVYDPQINSWDYHAMKGFPSGIYGNKNRKSNHYLYTLKYITLGLFFNHVYF